MVQSQNITDAKGGMEETGGREKTEGKKLLLHEGAVTDRTIFTLWATISIVPPLIS